MSVLDSPANLNENSKPVADGQVVGVAVLIERQTVDQLHGVERHPVGRHAALEHPGDVRVLHAGDRLPYDGEPGGGFRVESAGDDFQGHPAWRVVLVGLVHRPHPAAAEQPQHGVPRHLGPIARWHCQRFHGLRRCEGSRRRGYGPDVLRLLVGHGECGDACGIR